MQPLFLDSGRLLICSPSYVDAFSNVQDAVRVPAGILLFWLPVFSCHYLDDARLA